jgi:phenylpropionate dioxygenase-like ring-hydroxylating dioxygenase large terminal subunit
VAVENDCQGATTMMQPLTSQAGARLASDLDRGISLPASWYTDPAMVPLERDRIFRRTWQYVGRADQLALVGDYITGEAGGVPVLVVRGEQGLRGFVNVCRHRRHLVMAGAGNRTILQCPYHAWCYDLDGCLKSAPRANQEPGLDLADLSLLPVRVDTWGPFVFANADALAQPLAEYLGELPNLLARNGLDLTQLRFRQKEEWRTGANWKVLIENYLECYHCPIAHPGFSSVVDVEPGAYVLQPFEWSSAQYAPVRAWADNRAAYDPRGAVELAQYYYLWPNFALSIHPGHLNLLVHVWVPNGPEHTCGITERFFGPDVPEDFVQRVTAFSREVGAEDRSLTTSVQLGLRAGLPEHGRLLARSEQLVLRFQMLVLKALSGVD